MASPEEVTGSLEYPEADLEFFATQLRKSGRYQVNELTSTPERNGTDRKKLFNQSLSPLRGDVGDSAKISAKPKTDRSGHTSSNKIRQIRFLPTPRPSLLTGGPKFDHIHPRIPDLPTFSGDEKAKTNVFEVWKYDVHCLIDECIYPMHVIREAIRKSLKGTARGVLLHLGEDASVRDILTELEAVYGNVQTSERLKEQFYSERQRDDETVADYSMRLERLLSRLPGPVDKSARNEMLRSRLWSGLRDLELKNVSRYLYESIDDYNALRKELRAIEEDLRQSKASSVPFKTKAEVKTTTVVPEFKQNQRADTPEAKQFVTTVESKVLKQLEIMTKQMQSMEAKLNGMELEIKELKSEKSERRYGRTRYYDRGKESSKEQKTDKPTEKIDLNDKRPPS